MNQSDAGPLYSLKAGDQAPRKREEHIGWVVRLPHDFEPPIHHDAIPMPGLDRPRILDDLPRKLREGIAPKQLTPLHLAEGVFLAIGRIPHPVEDEIQNEKCCYYVAVPAILTRVMMG